MAIRRFASLSINIIFPIAISYTYLATDSMRTYESVSIVCYTHPGMILATKKVYPASSVQEVKATCVSLGQSLRRVAEYNDTGVNRLQLGNVYQLASR